LRTHAFGPIQLLLETLLPKGSAASTQEKIKASKHIFELLNHLKSEIAQEDYLQEVSKNAQISMQSLIKDFSEFKKLKARQTSYQKNNAVALVETPAKTVEKSPMTQTHWELLYLALNFPEYGKQIAYTIDSDSIHKMSLTGKFLSKLLAEFYETTNIDTIDTETLIETNEERQLLADIHTKELHIDDPIKLINECLRTLKKYTLNQKKTLLTQKIQQTDSNDVKFIELMKKVKQINQELIETQNLAIQ
jgi:DNA primase